MIEWAVYELDLKDYLRDGDLRRNPNPLGKIPTLTDQNGKIMVFQVGSILQYFQEAYGTRIDGGKIAEENEDIVAQDAAEINSWIVFANTDLESFVQPSKLGVDDLPSGKPDGVMSPYSRQNQQSGRLIRAGDSQQSRFQMSQQNLEGLDRLDELLAKKQQENYERYGNSKKPVYLVGDSFSLADVAVASYLLYLPQSSSMIDLDRWKALKGYMFDCASRDGYAYAFGRKTQAYVLGELESSRSQRPSGQGYPVSDANYRGVSSSTVYNDGPRGTRIFADGATPRRPNDDKSRGLFRPAV
jgi:glutathione S-transferase/alpha,alpha-trehalase